VDSIEPASDRKYVYHIEEVGSFFFEVCCQSSHIFHPAEEALDDIAHGVEAFVVGDGISGIAF